MFNTRQLNTSQLNTAGINTANVSAKSTVTVRGVANTLAKSTVNVISDANVNLGSVLNVAIAKNTLAKSTVSVSYHASVKVTDVEVMVEKNSLNIDNAIEERSTSTFVVVDMAGTETYTKGQTVKITDDDRNIIFAGAISKPVEKTDVASGIKYHTLTCVDWHYLVDKRIIAKAYENTLAGDIIRDFVTNYLSIEGITIGEIQDGPIVTEAVFNYVSITSAIDAVAEKANFIWFIGFDKKLYLVERSTYTSPFTITTKDAIKNSVSVETDNTKYRNKQYIKGGRDTTDPLTEKFAGDGTARTWVVGFPIAKVPTIKVNTITLLTGEVGIRGLDTDKKYYWSKGHNEITQDASQTLLISTDTLEITYQGEYDVIVITFDTEQIEERKAIEGNSGIVENIADEIENTTRDTAFQSGNAKLKKYGVIGRRLKFTIWKPGLKTGQLLPVNMPEHGINNLEMLIEGIDVVKKENIFYYKVTAVEGPSQQSWAKMFEVMATRGQAFVIRQNISEKQILITLATFSKTWLISDSSNIFIEVYPSSTLFPSTTLYPMFAYADRVNYIELLDSLDNILLRKKVTKQTGADTGSILSTTYVAPFEANGQIIKVRFYGGSLATDTGGSGVLIDEQVYSRLKTQLEAIQIDKNDIRGW